MDKEPKPWRGAYTLVRVGPGGLYHIPLFAKVVEELLPGDPSFVRAAHAMRNTLPEFPTAALELREYQRPAYDKILHCLETKGAALASLRVGFGKTIIALVIASRLRTRTLVLVHKLTLLHQWAHAISLTLPGARTGVWQGKTSPCADDHIVVGMQQTVLARLVEDPACLEGYGFVVIDEVHHSCARTFSKILLYHNAERILALSATLTRQDSLDFVLRWFLGEPCVDDTNLNVKPVVIFVKLQSFNVEPEMIYSKKERRDIINFAKLVTDISQSEERQRAVAALVANCAGAGRRVLVLSKRRAECNAIADILRDDHGISDSAVMLGGQGLTRPEATVIIATTSAAGEGFDCPGLNTLVLASSQKEVRQEIGRILRRAPLHGEYAPLVLDLQDSHFVFARQAAARLSYYRSQGLSVTWPDQVGLHSRIHTKVGDGDIP